jgi:hypothetical protein
VVTNESETKLVMDKSADVIGVNKSVFHPDSLFLHENKINCININNKNIDFFI